MSEICVILNTRDDADDASDHEEGMGKRSLVPTSLLPCSHQPILYPTSTAVDIKCQTVTHLISRGKKIFGGWSRLHAGSRGLGVRV